MGNCNIRTTADAGGSEDEEGINRGWKNANGMSPPKRAGPDGRRSLPVAVVERRMKNDGFAKYAADKKRIVSYLYGREMYWNLRRRKRVKRIKKFLADGAIQRMNMILVYYESGSGSSSSTPRDGDPNRSRKQHQVWRKTQEKILRFQAGKGDVDAGFTFTIFVENGIPYIQFLQGSKSCYIAAPAALVSYLFAIAELGNTNSTGRVEPIDTNRYIRHRFTNEGLERRVVGNHGGSSQDVLRDMVGSTDKSDFEEYRLPRFPSRISSAISSEACSLVSRQVFQAIQMYGPALVSCFDVTSVRHLRASENYPEDDNEVVYMPSFDVGSTGEDVLNYRNLGAYGNDTSIKQMINAFEMANGDVETTHYAGGKSDGADDDRSGGSGEIVESTSKGAPSPSSRGGEGAADRPHAMILIGSRSDDERSKHWFLLQNSWESMPVFEVSDSFLARHLEGGLRFVRRDITAAKVASGDISTVAGLHHECNLDDGGEEAEEIIEEGLGDY
jgi:hypothetical protein